MNRVLMFLLCTVISSALLLAAVFVAFGINRLYGDDVLGSILLGFYLAHHSATSLSLLRRLRLIEVRP